MQTKEANTTFDTRTDERPSIVEAQPRGLKASAKHLRESVAEAWRTQQADFERLRDELRLQTHLAGMDLTGRMQPLETQMRTLQRKVEEIESAADEQVGVLSERAAELMANIRKSFDKMRNNRDAEPN